MASPRRRSFPPPARPPHAPDAPDDTTAREKPLVLVVDDANDNREMYMEYFEIHGYEVAGADNGASGIDAARDLLPDLILMDMSMPGTDGWDATRVLKADPRTSGIVIVALTGHAEASHRARAAEVGCDLFVAKPAPPDEVLRQVRALLPKPSRSPRGTTS